MQEGEGHDGDNQEKQTEANKVIGPMNESKEGVCKKAKDTMETIKRSRRKRTKELTK